MSDRPTPLERGGLVVRGRHGHVTVARDELVIVNAGATASPSQVHVPLPEVRGATVVPARRGTPGWVHVAVVDGSPPPPGQLAAVGDPYTVALGLGQVRSARRFVRAVEQHILRRGLPTATLTTRSTSVALTDARPQPELVSAPEPALPSGADDDWLTRLGEVADLHRRGLLTDHELAAAKTRLLAERA